MYEFVTTFAGKYALGYHDSSGGQEHNRPAYGTQNPGDVKLPAGEKSFVMIEQVRLSNPVSITTVAMLYSANDPANKE